MIEEVDGEKKLRGIPVFDSELIAMMLQEKFINQTKVPYYYIYI